VSVLFNEKIPNSRVRQHMEFRLHLTVALRVNGQQYEVPFDARTTLLDLLRECLELTGTKKGCNFGECGACTVHLNGRRVNGCMILAASAEGAKVTTIEGIAEDGKLHPVQQAFIDQDAFAASAHPVRLCPPWPFYVRGIRSRQPKSANG
jgi:xanthine dehydrogenase iron-sulfur cluster and FAD-binding subunit A